MNYHIFIYGLITFVFTISSVEMHRVFVYGTLKKGEPNYHWLTKASNGVSKYIADGETLEKYPLIIGTKYNIPFLLYKPGTGCIVKGEIYEVDDKMFENLDILEDHPNFYEREQLLVKNVKSNENLECWVYFLKKFQSHLLTKEFYTSYSNYDNHGLKYCERYLRDPNYAAKNYVYQNKSNE